MLASLLYERTSRVVEDKERAKKEAAFSSLFLAGSFLSSTI